MSNPAHIISDASIDKVHAKADFGPMPTNREVVNLALFKVTCGLHNGSTAQDIILRHGLIRIHKVTGKSSLTAKGKEYLWATLRPLMGQG